MVKATPPWSPPIPGLTDGVSPIRQLLPRTERYIRDAEAVNLERLAASRSPTAGWGALTC
jgi:hypothetical protein